MKKFQLILLSIALTAFFAACGGNASHSHDGAEGHSHDAKPDQTTEAQAEQGPEYTSAYICPMHCEGSGSDKAGTCPVCGMDYVVNDKQAPKDADHGHSHDGDDGHSH